MTEDDTYNRLRRPLHIEMMILVTSTCKERNVYQLSIEEATQLLETHNWSYQEYIDEYNTLCDQIFKI